MRIYRCDIELMENLFFASREVNNLFQTEPVIGNYALAYALGFCNAGYHNDGEITYAQDLAKLREAEIYIMPTTFTEKPRFTFSKFNALSESYWYQMEQNAISVDRRRIFDSKKKARAANFPQIGKFKLLSIGNKGVFYILSKEGLTIPRYIRLGKFMSKAKLTVMPERYHLVENQCRTIHIYLNPIDLPDNCQLGMFDMLNIKPAPLIRNVSLQGDFYKLSDETYLPVGMRFYTDFGEPR